MLKPVVMAQGGGPAASFKAMWDEGHLYVFADVKDPAKTPGDAVEVFISDPGSKTAPTARFTLNRDGSAAGGAVVKAKEIGGGYILEASLPLKTPLALEGKIGFDIRARDAARTGALTSWNDPKNAQESDASRYGVLQLGDAVKVTEAVFGAPKIDAVIDPIWAGARVITTGIAAQGSLSATAKVRTMWDAGFIYVLAKVTDPVLNDASTSPYSQDSVEFFLDENNGKVKLYEPDDAQDRVSFKNLQSFGSNGSDARFKSAARIVPGGYVVEAAIPLRTVKAATNMIFGFDAQVNDADAAGTRQSIIKWSDPTNNTYKDFTRLGSLVLVQK